MKEKLSSSRIHCCYVIPSTEFKLSCCCVIISSGLKQKNPFYVTKTKECREKKKKKKKRESLSFPSSWEPQTPNSTLRVPDPLLGSQEPRLLINLPRNSLSQYVANTVLITHSKSKQWPSFRNYKLWFMVMLCSE